MPNPDAQSPPVMRLRLCGPVELWLSGEDAPRPVPNGKPTLLLAYLATHAGPVRRDELIDCVWPREVPADPQAGLSTLLSRLRQALGRESIVGGRTSVQLRFAAPLRTDVEDALAAVEEARRALGASDWTRAQACCTTALDLLAAGFLPGFDAPWIDRRRERIATASGDALELQGRAGLAAGGAGLSVAAEAAGRLVVSAPYHEAGYDVLMRALVAGGNDAEALRVYERLRTLLRDELGAAPSPELRQLHAAVLAQGAQGATVGRPRPAAALSPFVGRRAELGHLEALVGRPRGRLIAIRGEPGIGKSRLTAEAVARAGDDGGTVALWGRCDEETLVPYQPILEALREHVARCPADQLRRQVGDGGAELSLLLPALRRRLPSLPESSAVGDALERFRLFDHVARFVVEIAADTRLLLVLEDIHWADGPSLLLLRHLVRTAAQTPGLVVIVNYRDTEASAALTRLLAQLDRDGLLDPLPLDGLATAEISSWVASALTSVAPEPLAAGLTRRTGGNPLFVGELLRELEETGAWGGDAEAPVPPMIRQVIGNRIERLGPGMRRLLSSAAVVGEQVPFDVLTRLAEGTDAELVEVLDAAVSAGLLVELGSLATYRFAHALIRETLLHDLTRTRRVLLHQQVADVLEELYGAAVDAHLAELAHHVFEAAPLGGHLRAIDYCERAGRHADGMLAWEEAARHYDRALGMVEPAGLGPERRCDLLTARGEAERGSGNPAFRATLLEAAGLAEELGDPGRLARAALANNRGFFSSTFGVDEDRVRALRAALDAVDPEGGATRARLLAQLAIELVGRGDPGERVACSDAALAFARELGDPDTLALVLSQRFVTLWGPRTLPERRALAAEGSALASAVTERTLVYQSLLAGAHAALEAGDLAEADDYLERLGGLEAALRQPTLSWFGATTRAKRALLDRSPEEAERAAKDAFAIGTGAEQSDAAAWLGSQLWVIRFHQGRLAELPPPPGVEGAVTTLTRLLEAMSAAALAETGRLDEARPALEAMTALYADGIPHDWAALAIPALAVSACGHLDDVRGAAVMHRHLEPWAEQFVNFGPSWMGSTSYYLGVAERAMGRHRDAVERFTVAAAAHRAIGAGPWLARTQLEWAQTLLARGAVGDTDRAADLLEPALSTAQELGLAAVTRRGAVLLERARG